VRRLGAGDKENRAEFSLFRYRAGAAQVAVVYGVKAAAQAQA